MRLAAGDTTVQPGIVARIGAESVCLLSGGELLPRLESFCCLCAAITVNPARPRVSLPALYQIFDLHLKGALRVLANPGL